jgi:hypothetical protein
MGAGNLIRIGGAMEKGRNTTVAMLASIADDEAIPAARRMSAIDRLASMANIFHTRHHSTPEYRIPAKREKKRIIRLLRKLARSEKFLPSGIKFGIKDRLLFIKTNQALTDSCGRKWLWRVPGDPNQSQGQSDPEQKSSVVIEIEEALRKYREEHDDQGHAAESSERHDGPEGTSGTC